MAEDQAMYKQLAMQWKAAAPALRRARFADIRRQNNELAMDALNSIFRESMKRRPHREPCGFVEMYRVLGRRHIQG